MREITHNERNSLLNPFELASRQKCPNRGPASGSESSKSNSNTQGGF